MAQATDGTDPDLVVAKLVEEVTDDKSLDKQERKRLQIVSASKKSTRAKILKLADKSIFERIKGALLPQKNYPRQERM
jgi:hypothetical protein